MNAARKSSIQSGILQTNMNTAELIVLLREQQNHLNEYFTRHRKKSLDRSTTTTKKKQNVPIYFQIHAVTHIIAMAVRKSLTKKKIIRFRLYLEPALFVCVCVSTRCVRIFLPVLAISRSQIFASIKLFSESIRNTHRKEWTKKWSNNNKKNQKHRRNECIPIKVDFTARSRSHFGIHFSTRISCVPTTLGVCCSCDVTY